MSISSQSVHDGKSCASSKGKEIKLIADYSKTSLNLTHYIAAFLWMGWPGFYVTMAAILPILYRSSIYLFSALVGVVMFSALFSGNHYKQPWFLTHVVGQWILRKCVCYFQVQLYAEDIEAVNSTSPALFVMEPHDVMPLGMCILAESLGYFHPPHSVLGCATSAIFKVPLMKHFMAWTGGINADRRTIEKVIEQGGSPVICPGGVQEVLEMEHGKNECVLYLRRRRGIIKIAMDTGIPIVPMFTFGQRDAYTFWVPHGRWAKALAKKLQFSPMVYFGIFYLPFSQPRPVPINVVVGEPIPVLKKSRKEMTDEDILKVQNTLIAAMEKIYHENKDRFGMKDVQLRIV